MQTTVFKVPGKLMDISKRGLKLKPPELTMLVDLSMQERFWRNM